MRPAILRAAFALILAVGALLSPARGTLAAEQDAADPKAFRALVYREIDGNALKAYVFAPEQPAKQRVSPAILLFHGGGWAMGSADWTFDAARRFAAMGLVAISVDYRLSEGAVTPIDALADACAAFQWARDHAAELGLDAKRVAGYGVSSGGHLVAAAATLGCRPADKSRGAGGPDALVLWSPALDLESDAWFAKLLQGRAPAAAYSPAAHVHAGVPPVSIVIGAEDSLTPLSGAQRFCEGVKKVRGRCELNVYPGLGHLLTRSLKNQEDDFDPDPLAREDAIRKQREFLQRLWLNPEPTP